MEFFNIRFVKEVEKHPELYNYTLPEYSRKDFTDKAWNEVAQAVNLSVYECREKWRNLRRSFVKKLKTKPSDTGVAKIKKPYYLMDAMQFAIPFIKVSFSTGTLPEIRHPSPSPSVPKMEVPNEEIHFLQSVFPESGAFSTAQQPPSSPPPVQRPAPPDIPHLSSPSASPTTSWDRETPSPDPMDMETRGPHDLLTGKRTDSIYRSDIEKALTEYFTAKAAKMSSTSTRKGKRETSIHNFLISLVPDLEQMNDVQLRIFKRKALHLIDEVTGASPETSYRTIRNGAPSY